MVMRAEFRDTLSRLRCAIVVLLGGMKGPFSMGVRRVYLVRRLLVAYLQA